MKIFGWLAGGISALHNIPQIIHIYRRRSAKDISTQALVMRMLSLILYILHGYFIGDLPIIVMTGTILLQCVILCVLKYIFRNEETEA
jgi:MtN3 and saliva related transmembrane protein